MSTVKNRCKTSAGSAAKPGALLAFFGRANSLNNHSTLSLEPQVIDIDAEIDKSDCKEHDTSLLCQSLLDSTTTPDDLPETTQLTTKSLFPLFSKKKKNVTPPEEVQNVESPAKSKEVKCLDRELEAVDDKTKPLSAYDISSKSNLQGAQQSMDESKNIQITVDLNGVTGSIVRMDTASTESEIEEPSPVATEAALSPPVVEQAKELVEEVKEEPEGSHLFVLLHPSCLPYIVIRGEKAQRSIAHQGHQLQLELCRIFRKYG
jgi:hypothetical protein